MERKLDSQIFQVIDSMEDYLSNCKGVFMSSDKIQVNRDVMDEYIRDLKRKAPEEIEQYRKVIRRQEQILNDAKARAEQLIAQTEAQTDEMVSENEVMRRAYAQADDIVKMAQEQAQLLVDSAANEANELRAAASQYMEEVMVYLESVIGASAKAAHEQYGSLINTLNSYGEKIKGDHRQLHPEENEAIPQNMVEETEE